MPVPQGVSVLECRVLLARTRGGEAEQRPFHAIDKPEPAVMPARPFEVATAVKHASQRHCLQRHHDLAEVLVGFHVLERFSDLGERIDLVDRQLQLS